MVRYLLSLLWRLGLDHPTIHGGPVRIFGSTLVDLPRASRSDNPANRREANVSRNRENSPKAQEQSRTLVATGLAASILEGAVDLAKTRGSRLADGRKGLAESAVSS